MTIATVESQADLRHPGRIAYRISGSNAAAVQDAIDTLMAMVDASRGGFNGFANFIGPARINGGWGALGEVLIEQEKVA